MVAVFGIAVERSMVGRCLKLIFARIATAYAAGVPFDLSRCGVERGVRPLLYAGHSFRGVALRMDHELTGSACRDAPHLAAEQVRQLPNCASLCRRDDIHSEPSAYTPRQQTVAIPTGELPSSAAAAFTVLEGWALRIELEFERMALIANMCDCVKWSKRKVEGQRREKK